MKIDFNSGRVPDSEPAKPVVKQDETSAATDTTFFRATSALQQSLKNQPAVRPEKVQHAQALLSHSDYPPDDVLDRIAVLLATNVK